MRPIRRLLLMAMFPLALVAAMGSEAQVATASHTTRTYTIVTPISNGYYVTSPPRFHNGASCPTLTHFDHPNFDNTSICFPAANSTANWTMDIDAECPSPCDAVWLDIRPEAIDGYSAGGTYRLVPSDSDSFAGSGNAVYQYFGVHVYNSSTATWENYAWIVLGHIDFWYNSGTILCGPTTSGCTVQIGTVAVEGSYKTHVHMEVRNNTDGASWVSRSYEWDGPQNNADTSADGPCRRTPQSNSDQLDCNALVAFPDRLGYVGGSRLTFVELNNPYYSDF